MSYLPTARTPNQWEGKIPTPKANVPARLGPVSSGSSRNMKRGYVGAPEMQGFQHSMANITRGATSLLGRYLTIQAALGPVKDDLDSIAADVHSGLGAPQIDRSPRTRHVDGSPLAIGTAREPLALPRAGQTTNARSAVPEPRAHHFTGEVSGQFDGFASRLQKGGAPDARKAVGPSQGSSIPANPDAPLKGRRAPAGMDPRKRGTWMNYE